MVLFRLILFFIGDGAVQLLQGSDNATAGLIHGFDTGGSCLCGSHGCDVRDFLTDGCFTQVAVILYPALADRRIYAPLGVLIIRSILPFVIRSEMLGLPSLSL